MALSYDMTKIENYQELLDDASEQGISEVIIMGCMLTDMGEITEQNWREFYARLHTIEVMDSKQGFLRRGDETLYITPEMVRRRIGLKCNVATKTRAQWVNGIVKNIVNSNVAKFAQAAKEIEQEVNV